MSDEPRATQGGSGGVTSQDSESQLAGGARRLVRKAAPLFFGVAIVVFMVGYLIAQRELLERLWTVPVSALLAVMALSVATGLNHGGRFKISCAVFGLQLPYWQAQALTSTNTMLNYAVPLKGGFIMRAAYMKQRHGLSYTDYGALLASSQLIAVAAAGAVGLVSSWLAYTIDGVGSVAMTLGFTASVVTSAAVFAVVDLFDFTRLKPQALGRRLHAFSRGFADWRAHPLMILKFSGSMLIAIGIVGVRFLVIFGALQVDVVPATLIVIASAAVLSGALSITPGNLGIREAVVALSASLLGVDARLALLVSLIDRAAGILVTVAMGLVLSQRLAFGWRNPEVASPESEGGVDEPSR